ncbi:MAG: hypothetical protein AABM67_05110 [Acidobacteriota bacterium]
MNLPKSQPFAPKLRTFLTKLACPSLLLATSLVSGQTPRPTKAALPPSNYQDVGACPFECCTYRRWDVTAATTFYKDRSDKSAVVFRARKGERVTGLTGVVITLKPGKVNVRKATTIGQGRKARVKPGDVLYLLHYMGEGFFKIWFNGKIYENEMPPVTTSASKAEQEYFQVLNEPDTVWWMKVKNSRNQIGWSKQNDHFGNMDACG